MGFGLGYGGAYEVQSLTLPISPSPVTAKFFTEAGINTTASFVKVEYGNGMAVTKIENTGVTNSLEFSFDGTTVHGTIAATATETFSGIWTDGVWLKNGAGATTATVTSWTGKT